MPISIDDDPLVIIMREEGIPITRQNYIDCNWGPDEPDPWTAMDEDQIPAELQDWSKVEIDAGKGGGKES